MKQLLLRLAMRVEGDNWCGYAAAPDTMVGAIFLGSIAMTFVANNEQRKQAFLTLMTGALGELLADVTGGKVMWNVPVAAPEHERSKQ